MSAEGKNKSSFTLQEIAELMRFIRERQDQNQFSRKIDGAAIISGKDAIETVLAGEDMPKSGLLVHAEVRKGYEAVVRVLSYDDLEEINISDSRPEYDEVRMHISFGKVKDLEMAYENPNASNKHIQPFNRMQPTSYIGYSFEDLDILNLSDNGRLLIPKKPLNNNYGLHTSFDRRFKDIDEDSDIREITKVFDKNDYIGAFETIYGVLTKLVGVQETDAELIIQQIGVKIEK